MKMFSRLNSGDVFIVFSKYIKLLMGLVVFFVCVYFVSRVIFELAYISYVASKLDLVKMFRSDFCFCVLLILYLMLVPVIGLKILCRLFQSLDSKS